MKILFNWLKRQRIQYQNSKQTIHPKGLLPAKQNTLKRYAQTPIKRSFGLYGVQLLIVMITLQSGFAIAGTCLSVRAGVDPNTPADGRSYCDCVELSGFGSTYVGVVIANGSVVSNGKACVTGHSITPANCGSSNLSNLTAADDNTTLLWANVDHAATGDFQRLSCLYEHGVGFSNGTLVDTAPLFYEPSNQPTNAATVVKDGELTVTWTDSVTGDRAPEGYTVSCSTSAGAANPSDGSVVTTDTNCSDGVGNQNISHGTQTITWAGLTNGTEYFFRIVPHTNDGVNRDYKTDGTIATTSGTPIVVVPDNHPTSFTATANNSSEISTTWTDSIGTNLPDNYVVMCATSNSFTNPVNGTPATADSNCSDGSGIQNIAHGTGTATWSGLSASTQYFFTIFPSAGSATEILFKTDGTPQTADATPPAAPGGGSDDAPADEPNDHPVDVNASGNSSDNSIEVTWSDTSESPNYAVFCNTTGNFTDPVDGVPQTADANCGDGLGVQTVVQNTESSLGNKADNRSESVQKNILSNTWKGLESDTTYFFKIYPYNGSNAKVNYKIDGNPLTVYATTDGTSNPINLGAFGGEKVTPTVYKVTVSKIEFKNALGEYVTLAEEGTSYDVASVNANSPVGTFGKTAALPNGSYSEIRVTLSGGFEIRASGSDKGSSCRTDSNGSIGSVSSTLSNVSIGSSDSGTATTQVISYPSGSTATSVLSSAGISQSGSNLLMNAPISFTITDSNFPPNISVDIDVAGAVEVLTANGNCNVLPQPPSVNVKVSK